jgi:hypothetical protein
MKILSVKVAHAESLYDLTGMKLVVAKSLALNAAQVVLE